jgi:hypothetical protein
MQSLREGERRRGSRSAISLPVAVQAFPPSSPGSATAVKGEIRNLSASGMCLLLDEACPVSSLLRCEVLLEGSSATVPTLGHVRWTHDAGDAKFTTGVEFLI